MDSVNDAMAYIGKLTNYPWNERKEAKPFATAKRSHHAFYQSTKWRKLRNWYIQSHPICEECERKGIVTPGYFVDHIKPLRQGGDFMDPDNLQTLCRPCHASKTNKEIANNKKQ